MNPKIAGDRRLFWFFVLLAPATIWSWIAPHDRPTWWMETAPVFIAAGAMLATAKKFPLSGLLLVLIWLHCAVLLVGGHYTYAEVPAGEWVREWTGGTRNNYDKLGHFFQGFVPALLSRELLLRTSPLGDAQGRPASRWLGFLCVCPPLAFSAFYEMIEWWAAVLGGEGSEAFLGTQGYVWDTQSDMFLALVGAVAAVLTLSRAHDRSLAKTPGAAGVTPSAKP